MALANPLEKLQEEAICSICLEYMSDPVSIDCGHNFCRACITEYCREKGLGARGPLVCPQCREAFHKSNVRPNRQLANIVESIKQLGLSPAKGQLEALCRKHEEKLKLFCEEDGEAICVVCRESLEHRPHTVYPLEEAAQMYKIKLQKSLLRKPYWRRGQKPRNARQWFPRHCQCYDFNPCFLSSCACVFFFWKEVVKKKRERIVTEFEKLHRLLAEEEKQLLQKLEQEEKIILQRLHENLTRLLEQKFSLDKLILEIREKSQQSADMLLKDMKSTLSRCEAVTVQAPEACSVALRENYSIPEHCLGMRDMLKKFKGQQGSAWGQVLPGGAKSDAAPSWVKRHLPWPLPSLERAGLPPDRGAGLLHIHTGG
nr:E3 ubiquitin-protein ligase TRIM39-like [Pelodiscus sinensis]|eukprot:XP_014425409.2 E3 ubiquitin-protein ligase TRIM39-like [Pelodiscus sinensis]